MVIDLKTWRVLLLTALLSIACAGQPPRDDDPGELPPQAHVEAGRELLQEGQLAAAAERFRSALSLDGNYVPALEGLGLVALEQNDLSGAESYFRQAMRMDPGYARAYVGLGRLEAAGGNLPAAIENYRRAIGMDGDLAEAHYHLARAYEQTGQYSLAEENYKKTLDRDPNHSGAREDWRALADRRSSPDEMPPEYYLIVKRPVVTRGDLAALLARQLPMDEFCQNEEAVAEANDISGHWAADQISAVIACGLMPAHDDTTFRPRQPIIRRDCARLVADIILRFGDRGDGGLLSGKTEPLPDVPADDPDLESIRLATSLGIMQLRKDRSFLPDQEVNGYSANRIIRALKEALSP